MPIVGTGSDESTSRAYYAYQIASHLPGRSILEADTSWTVRKLQQYGERKQHKSMVNMQMKDMGPMSHDWRSPFERLKQYTVPEDIATAKEVSPILRGTQFRSRKIGLKKTTHPPIKPDSWNNHDFALYVEELTSLRPARSLTVKSMSYATDFPEPFTPQGIMDTLHQLIHSSETRKYLTVELCNLVLQFFYDRSMMHRARALYIRMEHLEMDISTPTFNILLRGSAAHHDLRNFTFLLDNMIKRGMKPNSNTWTAFLMTVDSKEVRHVVMDEIIRRGLMNSSPHSKKEVVPLFINYELSNFLDANRDLSSFFKHMSHRYGNDWLSTSAGNIMLSEVGRRISTAESLGLLYEMKHHAFAANEVTMNEMLNQSAWLGKPELAIEIINTFDQHWGLKPHRVAHQTLFLQAWRDQRLNFARVIWVSACLQGCVTFRMQNNVMQSLLSAIPKDDVDATVDIEYKEDAQSLSRKGSFKRMAGQFILGFNLAQIQKDLVIDESLSSSSNGLSRRQLQIKAARLALERNLATVGQGRLRGKFTDILRNALALDKQWEAEGIEKLPGLSWKIQNGLAVDIEVIIQDAETSQVAKTKEEQLAAARLRKVSRDYETSILSPLQIQDLARLARKPPNELTFRFGSRQIKQKARLNPSRRLARKRKMDNLTDD